GRVWLRRALLPDSLCVPTRRSSDLGYAANGLMGIAPESAAVTWLVPLRAAWLGLARAGDTLWASGGVTSRVYRFVPNGSAWTADSIVLADSMTRLFVGGLAVVPGRGLIAAVGNLQGSVYLIR